MFYFFQIQFLCIHSQDLSYSFAAFRLVFHMRSRPQVAFARICMFPINAALTEFAKQHII